MEIRGKYNTAVIFTDQLEESAKRQIVTLLDQSFIAGSKIRIMPDVHAGAGCTIGTTLTVGERVVPNLVGVDIGCGMEVVKLAGRRVDFDKLDKLVRRRIPAGFEVRTDVHEYLERVDLTALVCRREVNLDRARLGLGSLGGGNHFIEIDRGLGGALYLVVHSGSRSLGLQVAEYYQEKGYRCLTRVPQERRENLVATLKSEGRQREIQAELQKLEREYRCDVPKELAYLEGGAMEDYLHDMGIVQEYAAWNRRAIADTLLKGLKLEEAERFTTVHNYIDLGRRILRKGAVSAAKGEKLLIPMNMRDGSLICVGKGNEEWNCSAPHGAGRIMTRSEARQKISLERYQASMRGIYSTSVGKGTIDESPMAYKPMKQILRHIGETVDVVEEIKPVYNFKAGE